MKNKLAALPIRRKANEEKHIYDGISAYSPYDYEILLRKWPAEPHLNHLAAFSGPVIQGNDPGPLLVQQLYKWTKQLAVDSGHSEQNGIRGLKAVFLAPVDNSISHRLPAITEEKPLQFLTFIVPLACNGSQVAAVFPTDSSRFPQFHCLGEIMREMYTSTSTVNIHPATRHMIALLDKWLFEHHNVPHSLNQLFYPTGDSSIDAVSRNPLHYKDRCLVRTAEYKRTAAEYADTPVDKHAVNPYYGTGIQINDKPDLHLSNAFFGMGIPNYDAARTSPSKFVVDPEGVEEEDWVTQYPLHRAACESNVGAIRKWTKEGRDPNQLDGDGWSPLHYACWYGEIDAVIALIQEGFANVQIQNTAGSTPLHYAAGKGCSEVVEYLLIQTLANPVALDNEGRSPLAVCLECKEGNWRDTEQMLRHAYKEQVENGMGYFPVSPNNVMSDTPPLTSPSGICNQEQPFVDTNDLRVGSQEDMLEEKQQQPILPPKQLSTGLMRTSITYMNGHSILADLHKGNATLALEALQETCYLIELGLEYQFVFALWIASKSLAIQLGDTDKPLRLMEKWAGLLKRFSSSKNEIASLQMRRNVFFPVAREVNITDPKVLEYLYYDAQFNVLEGYYGCSEKEALQLAVIAMQIKHGDYNSNIHVPGFLKGHLPSYIPSHLLNRRNMVYLERQILSHYSSLSQQKYNTVMLYQKYLDVCSSWPYYGATFYEGRMSVKVHKDVPSSSSIQAPVRHSKKYTHVRLGINPLGYHVMHKSTNEHLSSYPLREMEWDMMKDKDLFTLQSRSGGLKMSFRTKQAALLHSLATQMNKEFDTHKSKVKRVRTKL